jgi:hypothetical protein
MPRRAASLGVEAHPLQFSEIFQPWVLLAIAEKPLNYSDPWEFGYALGGSRRLTLQAKSKSCVFCRENFVAGIALYGGLGTTQSFGLNGTSHYLGLIVQFNTPRVPPKSNRSSAIFGGVRANAETYDASMQVRWTNDPVVRRDGIPGRG